MQDLEITNIGTWLHDEGDYIYRFLVYKKVWTPYELDKKFSDESEYEESGYYNFAKIVNIIEIPNDILIEFEIFYPNDEEIYESSGRHEFHKLSDIKLIRYDSDNEIKEEE